MSKLVTIIGGGLAGSEAAFQLAERGIFVRLHEMRPARMTKAHKSGRLAELVCSNSLGGVELTRAPGILKEELRALGSLVVRCAYEARVPAGAALAVDRELFSEKIDAALRAHPNVEIVSGEVLRVPEASSAEPVIVATGPLTSAALAQSIQDLFGAQQLAFFDAISPIILGETIDHSKVFRQSRYDKGGGADYINLPLEKDEYYAFVDAVAKGEKFGGHEEVESDQTDNLRPFEGCMPIEEMIARGVDTLRFGPLKPVGLKNPLTGRRPYAVVQLRQDDSAGKLWSMVGFQTKLRQGEQTRIFRGLPGLAQAEFVRLGSVHRNSFIDSPRCLDATLQARVKPGLFFAGQLTGVEGYVESTAAGMAAAINVWRLLNEKPLISFSADTALGALLRYISDPGRKDFQPMNISFGIMSSYHSPDKRSGVSKDEAKLQVAQAALEQIRRLACEIGWSE